MSTFTCQKCTNIFDEMHRWTVDDLSLCRTCYDNHKIGAISKSNDGGPAFPLPHSANQDGRKGMSLREWLAGQALVGAIGTCAVPIGDENATSVAKACCKLADALLAELALQENQDAETQQ